MASIAIYDDYKAVKLKKEKAFLCPLMTNWYFTPFLSKAHNRNLLSIDFDQSTRVGKIYDDHRKFTLHIQYDELGRPVVWSPSSKYTEVNISYSGGGLLSSIHRGEWSERLEYENDRVASRAWVNGKIWSYTYADRVRRAPSRPTWQFCSRLWCQQQSNTYHSLLFPAVAQLSETSAEIKSGIKHLGCEKRK